MFFLPVFTLLLIEQTIKKAADMFHSMTFDCCIIFYIHYKISPFFE